MPSLAKSAMPFPEGYRGSYTKYKTMNFPATRQVRYFYANETAMQAAREAGWGRDIPEMLRNEDWNYAVFTPAKQHRAGVNQAECLACHKPLDKTSYLFTLETLSTAAKAR